MIEEAGAPGRLGHSGREIASELLWTNMIIKFEPSALSSARLQALLIRRGGGEWVIVSLTALAETAHPGLPVARSTASRSASGAPEMEKPTIRAVLRDYERAIEGRDARRLAQVWIMNPFEREHMRRLFEESRVISVSVEETNLEIDGDRALLLFDQQLTASRQRRFARAFKRGFQRTLAARDRLGNW